MIEKLEHALAAAFPPVTIERAMIDEPTSLWEVYEGYADLAGFEGKTWRELPVEHLVRHPGLLVYAGDTLFHAMLPAYLCYLLHERRRFNALPFQVAGQLTRKDDPDSHPRFDRRIARFTSAQRIAVRDVLALLATVYPIEDPMSAALATWNHL
jgi:hypothetical protein